MSRFFIVDTNVVVAGLLTSHADSPVARILDGMLAASFPFVLSEDLLAEYRTVLTRPHVAKLHGLSTAELDTVLLELARHAIVVTTANSDETPKAPDPGDQFLWDLLSCRDDLFLVTGDKLLLQDHVMQNRVLTPQVFVTQP